MSTVLVDVKVPGVPETSETPRSGSAKSSGFPSRWRWSQPLTFCGRPAFHWLSGATLFILTVLMTNVHRSVSTRTTEIAIRCLFFARYEEVMGSREVDIVLPGGSKVSDAVEAVRTGVSGGAGLPARPLVARNQRHAALDTDLSDGDELAFLPPLAGG